MSEPRSLFSRFRRVRPSIEADEAPIGVAFAGDPAGMTVEAFLETTVVQLRIHGPAGRLSDVLNRETDVRLERTDGAAPPVLDDVLVMIPPPQEGDRARRLHRPGRAVRVRIGPYEVTGDAHVPPGAQPTGFLLRTSPRFVPLTNTTVRSALGAVGERRVEVAIVNLQRAERFRDLTAEDQP